MLGSVNCIFYITTFCLPLWDLWDFYVIIGLQLSFSDRMFDFFQTLFKTLAISFSTMTLFTGITPLYGSSLAYGGPATLVWGWVVVSFFTWFVGLAMAEICSSFPVRPFLLTYNSFYVYITIFFWLHTLFLLPRTKIVATTAMEFLSSNYVIEVLNLILLHITLFVIQYILQKWLTCITKNMA